MNILDRIKNLCNEKGISQRGLEKELNLGNAATSKWITSSPNVETLIKIADYFGVSVDYLLGRDKQMKPPQRDVQTLTLAEVVVEEAAHYLSDDYKCLELAMRIKKLPERERKAFETLLEMAERKNNNEAAAGE